MELNEALEAVKGNLAEASAEEKQAVANVLLPFAALAAVQSRQIGKSGNARLCRIDADWEADQLPNHPDIVQVDSLGELIQQGLSARYLYVSPQAEAELEVLQSILDALGEQPHETWVFCALSA